jgi:hypothetical protein
LNIVRGVEWLVCVEGSGMRFRRSAKVGLYPLVTHGLRGAVSVAWIAGDSIGEAFRVS